MTSEELDEVDSAILHLLQVDARFNSVTDIAEKADVTANTVRNRIQGLEERGIIKGYVPLVDYEQADYQLRVVMRCTAPIPKRPELAQKALDIEGVIEVQELMAGRRNVEVTVVAAEGDQMTDAASALTELGFDIDDEELVKSYYKQPFDHFDPDSAMEE
ncbi:Lrp/AsnC family transcriptional regulator [Saliphagus sp. LR7]|uniref:Lrp/AsnC family transcriptional regulator n=1 Tax=Saliphagus sp. LR7 TaxID=2282654 RepID=UPI000DF7A323|nr:Lrp/AsnC family transcriptional regulator [Saliphagus sp. LR7]